MGRSPLPPGRRRRDNRSGHKVRPNFERNGVHKEKASGRWAKHLRPSVPLPARRGQCPRVPEEGAPPATPQAHPRDPPGLPVPALRPRPGPSDPAPPTRPPAPAPALRDVLVEVGEEQLVSASLAALTGQVHGGRAAGGWSRPEARARGGGRVHSGSAPGPARRRSRRCSLPRDQSPPHPSPLLFMLRSRGALRACAVRPFGARASHGAGVLRRSRPFTSGPG